MDDQKATGAMAEIVFGTNVVTEMVFISFLPEPEEKDYDSDYDLRTFFYGCEEDEENYRNGSEGWRLLSWVKL